MLARSAAAASSSRRRPALRSHLATGSRRRRLVVLLLRRRVPVLSSPMPVLFSFSCPLSSLLPLPLPLPRHMPCASSSSSSGVHTAVSGAHASKKLATTTRRGKRQKIGYKLGAMGAGAWRNTRCIQHINLLMCCRGKI